MWKLRLAKNRPARASTQSALETSADSPDSGSQALDNCHASSAAVAELVSNIGFAIDRLDYDGEPGDIIQLQLERLANEVNKYPNSKVSAESGEPWTCGEDLGRRLYAACRSSIAVYDSAPVVCVPGLNIELVEHRTASVDGTRKCTALWTVDWQGPSTRKELIVSIRGSATAIDHVVNLNGQERSADSILRFPTDIQAHAGFLGCTEALIPEIRKDIVRHVIGDPSITHLVFTGHSAGGAVASLLFLHFVHNTPSQLSSEMFSLFTFGSAPVISAEVTELAKRRPNVGLMLAFVNENDMVSRADGVYLRSIVDLYRSSHGIPPAGGPTTSSIAAQSTPVAFVASWPLPHPTFHLLGDIILLGEPTFMEHSVPEKIEHDFPSMSATAISHEKMNKLIFCDVEVHRRKAYSERLWAIFQGACRRPTGTKSHALMEALLKYGDLEAMDLD